MAVICSTKTLAWSGVAVFATFVPALIVAFYYKGEEAVSYDLFGRKNGIGVSFAIGGLVLPAPTLPTGVIELLHINYSTLKLQRSGSILHFEALVNHTTRNQYKCESFSAEVESSETTTEPVASTEPTAEDIPTIFFVTPTFARFSQKVDLTTVCHTLMLVPKVVWIVIEDAAEKTDLVTRLLGRCKVLSVHLNAQTPSEKQLKSKMHRNRMPRGVVQRNTGLAWLRDNCTVDKCNGVVYFGDDDNKYDLRLFEEMRKTEAVSVFPVAFVGRLRFEGPLCKDGKIDKWRVSWAPNRHFPIDMAGFAVNLKEVLEHPEIKIGLKKNGGIPANGYLETAFLEQFLTDSHDAECRGKESEVLVWHTHTAREDMSHWHDASDENVET